MTNVAEETQQRLQGMKGYWSAFRRTEYRVVNETLVIWDKTSSNVLCHVIFVKSQGLAYALFIGSCLDIYISVCWCRRSVRSGQQQLSVGQHHP